MKNIKFWAILTLVLLVITQICAFAQATDPNPPSSLPQGDALIMLGVLGIAISFVIKWMPSLAWPGWVKFALACALSLAGGYLTLISAGESFTGRSLLASFSVILGASQAFYFTAFKALGLEKVLFPKDAVATEAKEQIKEQVDNMSRTDAKEALDPTNGQGVTLKARVDGNDKPSPIQS